MDFFVGLAFPEVYWFIHATLSHICFALFRSLLQILSDALATQEGIVAGTDTFFLLFAVSYMKWTGRACMKGMDGWMDGWTNEFINWLIG